MHVEAPLPACMLPNMGQKRNHTEKKFLCKNSLFTSRGGDDNENDQDGTEWT